MLIKQVGNRFYRESRSQMRSFPVKAAEARELLVTGQAELVDHFLWEPEPEKPEKPIPGNVLDITARLKEKLEKEETKRALSKFKAEYLPYLTAEDAVLLAQTQASQQADVLMQICMRIDIERAFT